MGLKDPPRAQRLQVATTSGVDEESKLPFRERQSHSRAILPDAASVREVGSRDAQNLSVLARLA